LHDTASLTGRAFFECYGRTSGAVLDVGSLDVNGTLRPFVPPGMDYCGADMAAGPNVSLVLDDPYRLPFADEFDIAVSTSCFEHAEFFWLLFAEMARVVKPNGFIYMSAPVQGPVHRHPVDCWRFYPDAGLALANWADREGWPVSLVESFILPPGGAGWSDFVAVWRRAPADPWCGPLIADRFPQAMHR
jgi:SAM-dependent methyltransferase